MEVMIQPPAVDFNFDSACTSPYISAPSSPRRGNFFYSAPTSPTRTSAYFHGGDATSVPFKWEEKPGTPKIHISTAASSNYGDAEQDDLEEIDFAFDFSGQFDKISLPADELFHGGKIKPLKPPPKFQYDQSKPVDYSPKSPISPTKLIKEALSPRHRKKDFDPFEAALEQTRKESVRENGNEKRGREKTINKSSNSSSRKGARSLSPFRVSDLLFDNEPAKNSSIWFKKWRIKEFLLFRSASESRATDSDQIKKYNLFKKIREEDVKNSSFRSTDSGCGSVSSRRRSSGAPPVSAHELHYKINRAVSEEMKKRTFLPYKHGLLGCLGFYSTVPEISKGVGSVGGSLSRN